MRVQQQPIIGAWYVNANCQFLRVWGVVFNQGKAGQVVLSYLNGNRQFVDMSEWYAQDLRRYPQRKTKQTEPTNTSIA